ncbi:MAG: FAD-dependent oxidoreductase, partial [Thermomicrobiales bacterium]
MADAAYDLIVIGAGINGSGIARDASMRGLRVLLLDKGDAGSGTTSWSTRLVHGGLRYLEHGEIALVRESLRERERLLRIASHLVVPLPLLIPIYDGDRRGPMLIRAGMVAYDALSFDKSLPRHRMLNRDAALDRAPGLDARGLNGAALYYDAQVEYAERLAVENMLDDLASGADVLLYTEVTELVSDGAW